MVNIHWVKDSELVICFEDFNFINENTGITRTGITEDLLIGVVKNMKILSEKIDFYES